MGTTCAAFETSFFFVPTWPLESTAAVVQNTAYHMVRIAVSDKIFGESNKIFGDGFNPMIFEPPVVPNVIDERSSSSTVLISQLELRIACR
jgi:hypothetical protein